MPTLAPTISESSPEEIVIQMVSAKLQALESKEIEQYLALINEADEEYYTEQRNWFLIYQDSVTSDFSIEVQNVEKIDASTLVASLRQYYRYGPEKASRAVSYEQKYILTADGWKDADINFEVRETQHFTVKFQKDDAGISAAVCEEAEKAFSSVVEGLGLEAPEQITLKLYDTQELLRQSSDIRVAYLFNGWSEDGESIKMYARRERAAFAPLIAHELTHKITLRLTDSLNSWLAEGLAIYFGNQPFRGGNPLEVGQFLSKDLSHPISWLEDTNLIQLTDGETIKQFYAMSSLVVEFMVETYGLDQLRGLLDELSKYPRYDHGFDYDQMEQENQKRLHQAIEIVLGMDMDAFNLQWLQWIASQ